MKRSELKQMIEEEIRKLNEAAPKMPTKKVKGSVHFTQADFKSAAKWKAFLDNLNIEYKPGQERTIGISAKITGTYTGGGWK